MTLFRYKAINNQNVLVSGIVESTDESTATSILREKELTVLVLKEKSVFSINIENYLPFLNRIKVKDIVIFSRQFSVMISANLVVVQALRILIDQTENTKFKTIISEIAYEVDNGSRLSDALEKKSNIFSKFYISVIRSGEVSGKLDEVLNYLADEIEKDYDMLSKIKGAMIYPAFIVIGLLGVGSLMMIFVVPKLTEIFKEAGSELPLATKILMKTSDFMVNYWYVLLIIIIGAVIIIKYYVSRPIGKAQLDLLILKLPVFGNLFQKIYIVRFARSMNTLIVGGITIIDSLKVSSDIIDNEIYKKLFLRTIKEVEEGNTISGVFVTNPYVPKMVSHMIGVGEKTGKIDVILEKISQFYSREIDNIIATLMSLMEPVIMVVIGIVVGGMVMAIIMPMYSLSSQI